VRLTNPFQRFVAPPPSDSLGLKRGVRSAPGRSLKLSGSELLHRHRFRKHRELLLVFPRLETCVFLTPKVGTTLLKRLLWEHFLRHECPEGSDWLHNTLEDAPFSARHTKRSLVQQSLVGPACRRFILVRNPYTRLLSGYRDKLVRRSGTSSVYREQSAVLRQFAAERGLPSETSGAPVPFATFVHWVVATPWNKMNPHWCEQVWLSLFELVDYTDVYRIEDGLELMATGLMVRLGADPAWVQASVSQPLNETAELLEGGYDAQLAKMVFGKYRRDFMMLGYAEDSWR
jgi:hypothetical protein